MKNDGVGQLIESLREEAEKQLLGALKAEERLNNITAALLFLAFLVIGIFGK